MRRFLSSILAAQYAAIGAGVREAVDRVLASQHFVLGREGTALEQEIAALCQVPHGVALASGTDALILALRACGVRAGDEVILPPFTFVATGSAVSALNAKPVFADIRLDTYNIDPAEIERRITPQTRAIIAVHLYWIGRGYGSDRGVRAIAEYSCDRRQRAGDRRVVQGAADWIARRRGVSQLLPDEKSWCLRRRGNGCHEVGGTGCADTNAAQPRADGKICERGARVEQPTR